MDMNPYANMQQQQASGQGQPGQDSFLAQQNNPTAAGAVNNMIRAIMAGQDDYQNKAKQAMGQPQVVQALNQGALSGPASQPVQPQAPVPFTDPSAMTGGLGAPPAGGPTAAPPQTMPFQAATGQAPAAMTGTPVTAPVSMDPVSQALMSPIPGMSG
jgi:hypothetical protein